MGRDVNRNANAMIEDRALEKHVFVMMDTRGKIVNIVSVFDEYLF